MNYKVKFISLVNASGDYKNELDFGAIEFTGIPNPSEVQQIMVDKMKEPVMEGTPVKEWCDEIGLENIECQVKPVKPKMDAKVLVALQNANHQLDIFTCDEDWKEEESNKDLLEQLETAQEFLWKLQTWSTIK